MDKKSIIILIVIIVTVAAAVLTYVLSGEKRSAPFPLPAAAKPSHFPMT